MVEVHSISKKFLDHWALKDCSWKVQDKRSVGLLGPNGAGKSTTMKIITGLLTPTGGTVTIDGVDLKAAPVEAKNNLGYLPEDPPLYPELQVNAFLRFVCGLKGVPKKQVESAIDDVVAKLQLKDVLFRPIKELSKGFRQRVGIAQALVGDPALLILDEPSVGLDPQQRFELRQIIKGLKSEHTVILSSHILSEVQDVCDDVVILNKGEIKAQGPLETLLKTREASGVIEITLTRMDSRVEQILSNMPNVYGLQVIGQTLELQLSNQAEQNLDPFLSTLSEQGCGVKSVVPRMSQLEDVFMEVTQ